MKKLMIAMSVATMAALCAQAGIPTGYTSGIDFENTALGNLNVLLDDTNTQQGTDLKFWASAAASTEEGTTGQVESQIVDGSQIEGSTNTGKFLKVDETLPLQRSMAGVDANGIPTPTAVGTGIEISSRVQFTAADEAPTASDGDKLLVWMQAAAEAEGTAGEEGYKEAKPAGVMVTDATGTTMIKELAASEVEAFTAAWHTLVIKSTVTGEVGLETLAFKVTLDGVVADKTFASLVDSTVASATTISSIGFQGTGAVDDIGFKTIADVSPTTVEVSGTVSGYDENAGYEVVFQDAAGEDVVAPTVGDTFKVVVTGALATDNVTCEGLTFTYADELWTAEYTVTEADGAAGTKVFAVTVAKGGEPTDKPEIVTGDGQTVEAAVAAANSETGIVVKNCTAADVTINGTSITVGTTTVTISEYYTASFDAAGSKITLTLNEKALEEETAVSVDAANLGLTISNSKAKLYYGLATSTTVDAGQYTAPTTLVQGTGNALTLTAEKNGNACFYKLYVTDIAPTAVK